MRVGTARKGFTEKVEFELNVKAGKDSDRRKSGWTFNIKGPPRLDFALTKASQYWRVGQE